MIAPALVEALKILSQKNKDQLAEAKKIAYKEGFYNGTMIVGEFSGERVQDAKPKVRESMIKQGVAFAYAEPDGLVISRSGYECVVALLDLIWIMVSLLGERRLRSEFVFFGSFFFFFFLFSDSCFM
jgi:leucyl-tRNA synthetase